MTDSRETKNCILVINGKVRGLSEENKNKDEG